MRVRSRGRLPFPSATVSVADYPRASSGVALPAITVTTAGMNGSPQLSIIYAGSTL